MAIPELNANGFLPVGRHDCTLAEVRARFGAFQSSDQRPKLIARLEALAHTIRTSGLFKTLLIDGSLVTAIYATAMDYSPEAETTQTFFATVQSKLHFAIHGRIAAELIVERANSKNERMGLTTFSASTPLCSCR